MAIITGDGFGNNLFGTNEDDQLFGLGGFDLLFASLGNDTLDGGTDTDVAIYDVGSSRAGSLSTTPTPPLAPYLPTPSTSRGSGRTR